MKDKLLFLIFILFISHNINAKQLTQNNSFDQQVSIVNNDFTTENALHDAVRANDIELVKLLIKQNILKNQPDQYGYTPLHLAVRLHNLEIVKYLIEQGADINTIDTYGDTPLLDSTRNNDTEISEFLICNGAYRNVVDKNNMSTLNNSSKNNNTYITKLLMANDLEPYCKKEQTKNSEDITNDDIDTSLDSENMINDDINTSLDTDADKEVENKFILDTKDEIYKALMEEFENDFTLWNASLEQDTLTFRLENTTLLFNPAQKNLKDNFKQILNDFFPRYIDVLLYFQSDIDQVIIEGHSSSEYSKGVDDEDKYNYNLKLSQDRADEVLRYLKDIDNKIILENFGWITTTLKSIGKSSSNLILNDDGTENKELSRRIDFIIKLKQRTVNDN